MKNNKDDNIDKMNKQERYYYKKYPITPLIIHTNKKDNLKIETTYDEEFDLWRINIEKEKKTK